jgi:type 1 glutamine amidotransferase
LATQVLLVSAGLAHPSLLARFWLRRGLVTLPGYDFQSVASLEALPHLPLTSFQALVLYVHHEAISPAALEHLERFVGEGGGLLAVHSASASFKEEPRYYELLGGRFVEHGPVEAFAVLSAPAQGEQFAGIAAFEVRDELYRHEYDPTNRVHFTTPVGEEQEPVVWTRRHGQGRVCYCALGHTASSMRHPRALQILRRGLAWVCGNGSADPEPPSSPGEPAP